MLTRKGKKKFSVVFSPLFLLQLQTKSTKISYLARHAQSTLQFANLFNFFSINKWGGGTSSARCFLKGEFDNIPIPPLYRKSPHSAVSNRAVNSADFPYYLFFINKCGRGTPFSTVFSKRRI